RPDRRAATKAPKILTRSKASSNGFFRVWRKHKGFFLAKTKGAFDFVYTGNLFLGGAFGDRFHSAKA
ncbi:MAG: hypothetical protein IK094_10765, partial [Treponema sp.]|nr:hypothetical protein [Treponema sp.]